MSNWVPKSAKPDRSEIRPYLGGLRTTLGGVPLSKPKPFKWISVQRRHKAISVNNATAAA